MGYRAHVVTQHRKYGSEIFSDITEFEGYRAFLQEEFETEMESEYCSENEDYYEVPFAAIKKEIERLKTLPADDIHEHYSHDTNEDIIRGWEEAMKEAPEGDDYVTLEWF
jgi:hypothetical protein